MKTTLDPTKQDIREVLDEFFQTGYSVKDFCSVTGHDEAVLQNWIEEYDQGMLPDPNAFLIGNLTGFPQKQEPPEAQSGVLFAKIGDIELYQYVPSDYLKSLKS